MSRTSMYVAAITAGALLLLSLAPRAGAQCFLGSNYDGIGTRAGTPFQAEKTTTFLHETQSKLIAPERPPVLVARDGQGRLRIEMTGGKFKVEEGEGAGTEAVQHMVTICDPISQKLFRLDTLNKTATIVTHFPASPRSGVPLQGGNPVQRAYCRTFAPILNAGNQQSEDLGHQIIEGWDAQGVRTTRPIHMPPNGEGTEATITTETWCSEELAAMLLKSSQSTGPSATKSEMKLTKIVPGEPDPALFQIPSDYRVVERVPEEKNNGQLRPFGAAPAGQPSTRPAIPPQ